VLYPSELRGRSKISRNIRYLWHLLIWVGDYDQIQCPLFFGFAKKPCANRSTVPVSASLNQCE
jgi:hypothetical protein